MEDALNVRSKNYSHSQHERKIIQAITTSLLITKKNIRRRKKVKPI